MDSRPKPLSLVAPTIQGPNRPLAAALNLLASAGIQLRSSAVPESLSCRRSPPAVASFMLVRRSSSDVKKLEECYVSVPAETMMLKRTASESRVVKSGGRLLS